MLALFFIPNLILSAEINMAIIDTGFCPSLLKKASQIEILATKDLTGTVKQFCLNKDDPRMHGQSLLEEFLAFYHPKRDLLKIHPLVVYDDKGRQKSTYWLLALEYLKNNKIDVVLTASGLPLEPTDTLLSHSLKGLWFVPSGRTSVHIKKGQKLFPQELAPKENLFVIGDYFEGDPSFYDEELFYQEHIDYYFASGKGHFTGTSRAVGEALARALNLCPLASMRSCLKKESKVVKISLSKKTVLTY